MRLPFVALCLFAFGCGSSKTSGTASGSGSGSSEASGSAGSAGSGGSAGSAGSAATPAVGHALPAAAAAKLAVYGAPHGTAIYVPAIGKDVEHWIAFVGGDVALSAWLVTPSDAAHLLNRITDWPTGTRVTGGMVEAGPHGFAGNADTANAYVLVESRGGLGQPAGLRGVVRIEVAPAQNVSTLFQSDEALLPLTGVTDAAALGAKLDAMSADVNATLKLLPDDATEKLAATLTKADAAELAALVPKAGIDVATTWQQTFVAPASPGGHLTTVDELVPLLANHTWSCAFVSCTDQAASVVLGTEGGHPVIRALLRHPRGPTLTAGARHAVPPATDTAPAVATAHALGMLDAKVMAAAASGAGWAAVVSSADGTILLTRDGDVVAQTSLELDDGTTPSMMGFLDVDGDGLTDVAVERHPDGVAKPYVSFTKATGSTDSGAGITAIGTTTIADAIQRALAMPDQPVKPADACALLKKITSASSLAKASGGSPMVYAFTEPGQPERQPEVLGKTAAQAIHDDLQRGCALTCDPIRPFCYTTEEGPGTDFFLFMATGRKLQLWGAAVYRGS